MSLLHQRGHLQFHREQTLNRLSNPLFGQAPQLVGLKKVLDSRMPQRSWLTFSI